MRRWLSWWTLLGVSLTADEKETSGEVGYAEIDLSDSTLSTMDG